MDINEYFEHKHLELLKNIQNQVDNIYQDVIAKVSITASSFNTPLGVFSFDKIPPLKNRVNQLLGAMGNDLEITIMNGIRGAWQLSNIKNDAIVDKRISKKLLPKKQHGTLIFYDSNKDALEKFIARKENGMRLSDKVWKPIEQYRLELEKGLALGISKGQSATAISGDLRKYLNNPTALFRRVQDTNGNLKLSKTAINYRPGQGVYRSSYKNALRLVGTETSMAYRMADMVRYQNLPFVVGYEVKLSNNHPMYDICDDCKGKYPKTFIFRGWHPQCRCYVVPVMVNDADYSKIENAILNDGPLPNFKNSSVNDVPDGFKNWIEKNKEAVLGWKNQPYWVKDNFVGGDMVLVKGRFN